VLAIPQMRVAPARSEVGSATAREPVTLATTEVRQFATIRPGLAVQSLLPSASAIRLTVALIASHNASRIAGNVLLPAVPARMSAIRIVRIMIPSQCGGSTDGTTDSGTSDSGDIGCGDDSSDDDSSDDFAGAYMKPAATAVPLGIGAVLLLPLAFRIRRSKKERKGDE
jgi:hypothetical protein